MRLLWGAVDFSLARAKLIEHLAQEIRDVRVLQAMELVPREIFVPPALQPYAYEDRPLPIGKGQTISQPYIVALMTQALDLKPEDKVLEVGTGSGYQAAILSLLAQRVITVERLPALAAEAEQRLRNLGYANIEVRVAQQELGWPQEAPYDAIVVTAAAPTIARQLTQQLKVGGRLVIPVGSRQEQELLKAVRKDEQTIAVEHLSACRFVLLFGEGAWSGEEEDGL